MRRTGKVPAKRAPLSNPTIDVRTFPAAASGSGWREISLPRLVTVAAVGAILSVAVSDAAWRGPWLDEFWTLELSDNRNGLLALMRDGWLRDTHPPLFNAWGTLLASFGVTSIAAGRLVSNLLAAGLMLLASWSLSKRMPEHAGFNMVLVVLVLSLPQATDAFATYRSYFWQIAAIATLASVARLVASTRVDLDLRRDVDLVAIAAVATAAACSAACWPAPSCSRPFAAGCGAGRRWCWRRRRWPACSSSRACCCRPRSGPPSSTIAGSICRA
jgi:hypothetical protein